MSSLLKTRHLFASLLFILFSFTNKPVRVTGTLLFTSTRDGNWEVYTMDADGKNQQNLSNHPGADYGLGWSPDGSYILFYSNRDGNEDIWKMDADGKNPVNLTKHPAAERAAAWSPDGKEIAFITDRDGEERELYLMNADGSNQRRVTYQKSYIECPVWLKDGSGIIFTMMVNDKTDSGMVSNGDIHLISKDGKKLTRLTTKKGFDSGACFSPDFKKIAFYGSTENKWYDIFLANADGSKTINLTNDVIEDYSPSWSPDGEWIAFTSGAKGKYDIWLMNINSKEKIQLT
ncbi:MAG: TolB family protein, partial [Sediminibacterium sp.]